MADQPELYTMSDSRYNPFDETWSPRGFGYDMGVDPENRDIPSSSPYFVTLWEQPRKDTPSTMVVYDNDTATTLTEVDAKLVRMLASSVLLVDRRVCSLATKIRRSLISPSVPL